MLGTSGAAVAVTRVAVGAAPCAVGTGDLARAGVGTIPLTLVTVGAVVGKAEGDRATSSG